MRIHLTRTHPLRPTQWAGVSRYTACMVQAMRYVDPTIDLRAFHFSLRGRLPDHFARLATEYGVAVQPVRWPDWSGVPGYYEWLDRWVIPRSIERSGADIAWGTNCSVPSSRGRRFRSVVTIHDLFLYLSPELSDPDFRRHTVRAIESLHGHCDLVLTDSEFSRRQIVEHLNFAPHQVVVTHLAPAPTIADQAYDPATVRAQFKLDRLTVLSVGTVEARKTYVDGMQAFARVRAELAGDIQWLIVGGKGWQAEAVLAERERLQLGDWVRIHHDVSDADLAGLYRGARCLFLPSPHEGFGLPAVEAMQVGLPVVAARAGAIPEVVGDAAELVEPRAPDEMARGLVRVLTDAQLREQLTARGLARSRSFSWSAAATRALDAFRGLVS